MTLRSLGGVRMTLRSQEVGRTTPLNLGQGQTTLQSREERTTPQNLEQEQTKLQNLKERMTQQSLEERTTPQSPLPAN